MRTAATLVAITLVAVALLLAPDNVEARPMKHPTYAELFQKSDVVVLLRVSTIEARSEAPQAYGIPDDSYHAYKAHCPIISTFKGSVSDKTISLLFFQHPDGRFGFNGVMAAPFYEQLTLPEEHRTAYLAYLRKDASGQFVPFTGHRDAGISIKAVPQHFLPHHFSVLQPRDKLNKPVERTGKPRRDSPAARR